MTLINPPALTAALIVAGCGLLLALLRHNEAKTFGQITLVSIFYGLLCLAGIVGVVVCVTPLWGLV